ncbi:MAG: hypothetical protein ACE5JI_03390 [Acidobacteriota bacterium]
MDVRSEGGLVSILFQRRLTITLWHEDPMTADVGAANQGKTFFNEQPPKAKASIASSSSRAEPSKRAYLSHHYRLVAERKTASCRRD